MFTIDIKSMYNKYYRRKLLLDIRNVLLKKFRIVCDTEVLHKNVVFSLLRIKEIIKDKFAISYLFSVLVRLLILITFCYVTERMS